MVDTNLPAITVVISTYQRADLCERALRSVLLQSEPPLEVLVCDNGSTDNTEARMRQWQRTDERVRYLRTETNSGTPATTRNIGVEHARGELVAFLDDDDEWLPEKLASQRAAMTASNADVLAANALRGDGCLYFPAAAQSWQPTEIDLLRANPIITSTALVRRTRLLAAGGFPTDARLRGLEDYATWLKLAGGGARFLVLGDALVHYDDTSNDRLSVDRARIELAVARLVWHHALRWPLRLRRIRTAVRRSAGAIYVAVVELASVLRACRRAARSGQSPLDGDAGV